MITNTGKSILAKYLIGQTPSYASYIAVGCGAKPLDAATETFGDYSGKNSLDFEMFRVPITSRGYVVEPGTNGPSHHIVFTAELPTQERYEITEVGVFPAANNQAAGNYDSRLLFGFTDTELWEHHTVSPNVATSIPSYITPLDATGNGNNIIVVPDESVGVPTRVFQTNASNAIFANADRVARYERCRLLDNTIMVRGDDSQINSAIDGTLSVETAPFDSLEGVTGLMSNHIHLSGITMDLDNNASTDEMRLAFSVVNTVGEDVTTPGTIDQPDKVKILLEFRSTEGEVSQQAIQYANFEVELTNLSNGVDFSTNRYFVVTKKLEELKKSIGFTWKSIDVVKISASVEVEGYPTDKFYVALDAIRIDNVTTLNPLYGLTAYSVMRTTDAETVVKANNTSSFIEFRFGFGLEDMAPS